jgi:hypothetical protein
VKLSVDGFALFVFPLIPFPKLQNSCSALSFPGVPERAKKMPGFPTQSVGTPTNRGPFVFAQDKKARRYVQRKQTGESASLQRLWHD